MILNQLYFAYFLAGLCYATYLACMIHFNLDAVLAALGMEIEMDPVAKLKLAPVLITLALIIACLTWPLHIKGEDKPNAS